MPEYQFVNRGGEIVSEEYDSKSALSSDDVKNRINDAFKLFPYNTEVTKVPDYDEVYLVKFLDENDGIGDIYITAKSTTPGGRSTLKDEQRIQIKARYLNFVNMKKEQGNRAVFLGIYERDGENIFCTWKVTGSSANSPETPISKQIKIESIAKAMREGFVQQDKGGGEYACVFRREFLFFYLRNCEWLHTGPVHELTNHIPAEYNDATSNIPSGLIPRAQNGRNVLLYGVPGCGKSYTIQRDYCDDPSKIERIVFHPDYMNTDLVGQILPTVYSEEESGEKIITYKFTPGPLTRILKKAYEDPGNEYFLIIEEINRGNAPAIFGELFQLLDREPDGSSSYGISNENIADYVYGDKSRLVSLPSNLSILATMNTADQNVFTLDTAFQRRWRMKMIRNDVSKAKHANQQILDTGLTWKDFNEVINNQILSSNQSTMSSEDKRLGAYFITLEVLTAKDSAELFAEKVIKYLWDDAFKFSRTKLFNKDFKSLEEVVDNFVTNKGLNRFNIFLTEIKDSLKTRVEQASANNSTEQVEEQVTAEENSEG